MALTEIIRDHLNEKINALAVGDLTSLRELYGDGWETLGSAGVKRAIGGDFHRAVAAQEFPQLEFVRIMISGRHNQYRKFTD